MVDRHPDSPQRKTRAYTKSLQFYRSKKNASLMRLRIAYERTKQFFALPRCYRQVRAIKDCKKPRVTLILDLLLWFFSHKTFPDHYGMCRLWEVQRGEWKYYYGSNYHPYQRQKLRKFVQPHEYRVLFNNKYLCVLLCQALGIRVPQTYGVLEPAQDFRGQITAWLAASPSGKLVIKPLYGEMGRDIVLAERATNSILIKSGQASTSLEDYVLREKGIVQEVLTQDARMAAFSAFSVNTLRIVTMMTPQNQVLIVNASFRSGVAKAFVDNWSAGGVSVGIDCEKGVLKKYAYDKISNRYPSHPTSGIVFENHPVPEWNRVCAMASFVQLAFSFYRLIGLDIAIDQTGHPVLIEANGAPDLAGLEQKAGPLLKSKPVLRAFGEYDLLVNKHQKKLFTKLDEHPV
jgi:hypothetical protein